MRSRHRQTTRKLKQWKTWGKFVNLRKDKGCSIGRHICLGELVSWPDNSNRNKLETCWKLQTVTAWKWSNMKFLDMKTTLLEKAFKRRLQHFINLERISSDHTQNKALHARFKGKAKTTYNYKWILNYSWTKHRKLHLTLQWLRRMEIVLWHSSSETPGIRSW